MIIIIIIITYGQCVRGTKEVRDPRTWDWLKRGTLKKETEALLTAASGPSGLLHQEHD